MSITWRDLKIGDRIQMIEWPPELDKETLHGDTIGFYEWAIESGSQLTVVNIDEWGIPWGKIIRTLDGIETTESIGLNHSGYVVSAP
ncbi:hypothetical protein HG15A2_39620 [Adhaeretor mobilis]|uniref:Uncharacterized protein n=1 Tax=Adhaeretor mobilis TaxID=1930276 RepID=A0A517N0H1_9BACT|nr:hypothetical protein HG15A2_39620 [Adhaeretor mobilis]